MAHQPASPAPRFTPHEIVCALGLDAVIDVESLDCRRQAFSAVHLGKHDVPIGSLLDVIQADEALLPPRTGHIGNWDNIVRGRSSAQDFNQAICAPGHGYPLLYCFNQTEADEPRAGDWGYVPGSLLEGGERRPLRLFAWDGAAFAPVPHARPYFTPLVKAEAGGAPRPLIEIHRERLNRSMPYRFELEQAIFARHEDVIRPFLHVLLEDAASRENHERALRDLISHAVTPGGELTRTFPVKDGGGYQLGECHYASTDALVEHALIPCRAVARSAEFFENITTLPSQLPVISNLLTAILSAILQTHYPDGGAAQTPFIPHLHWGGRDMAGYPPWRSGYLFEDAKVRSMRRICRVLVREFRGVPPVSCMLLPAAVFMLCPAGTHARDAGALAALFRWVCGITPARNGEGGMQQAILTAVADWYGDHAAILSPYFRGRFGPRTGGIVPHGAPDVSESAEPASFRDLTFRQASMIAGALYEVTAAQEPRP